MRTLVASLLASVLLAPLAFAHTPSPGAAAPAPQATGTGGGTRDPRVYFTDAELRNQDAQKVRFYSDALKGRAVVLNVAYTSCNDGCPLITQQLLQVRKELGEAFGRQVFFVTLTSDPEHDTPAALKTFAQKHGADVPGWTFLTGQKEDVHRILQRLGTDSENVEDHATILYLLDVDARRMRRMLPNVPPKAIAEAVRRVATGGR